MNTEIKNYIEEKFNDSNERKEEFLKFIENKKIPDSK